jgi:Trypsin-like peptidase domain
MLLYNTDDNSAITDGTPTGLYTGVWREIWRINGNGNVYRTWEKIVPRIDDSVLDCAIYLYHSETNAIQGDQSGGSGFLVGVPFGWDVGSGNSGNWATKKHHIYAATNSHVITLGAAVVRLNTKEGETEVITPASWIHSQDDDIAVAPIEPDRELYKFKYISIGLDMFVTQERLKECAIGPGDETFAVGRFIARNERQSNAPIVRFGHVSGLGTESIERSDGSKQESFLVENHSISGFSGSPVFIWIPIERTKYIQDPKARSFVRQAARSYRHDPRVYFLGIDWGHLEDDAPPGMAGVVPAWKLLELLCTNEVIEMRREKEKSEAKMPRGKLDLRFATQLTTPKKGEATEIPIPTERQFFADLAKITRRKPPQSES